MVADRSSRQSQWIESFVQIYIVQGVPVPGQAIKCLSDAFFAMYIGQFDYEQFWRKGVELWAITHWATTSIIVSRAGRE